MLKFNNKNIENTYSNEILQAKEKIQDWKKQWNKIIYIEWVFDLLHPGHKVFFNYIKRKIEKNINNNFKIIVAIESDNIVKKKKWKNRPIENEQIRKEKVQKLNKVDLAFINDSLLRNLIDNLKFLWIDYIIIPDEYIKNIKILKKFIIPLLKKNWIKIILSRHKQYELFWIDKNLATIHTTNILNDQKIEKQNPIIKKLNT